MAGIRGRRRYLPAGPPGRGGGGRGPAPVGDHVHRIITTGPCPPAQDIGHLADVRPERVRCAWRRGKGPAREASGCEKLLYITLLHAARGGDDDRPGRPPTPAVAR